MKRLADCLATLPLPSSCPPTASPPSAASPVPEGPTALACGPDLVHVLGGGLPAGHLHVWGGPTGAGKTSFLLGMLHGVALRGRPVIYATYDLPACTLACRLLAMAAGVEAGRLAEGALSGADAARAATVRDQLSRLPFFLLEARGLGSASLEDRLVRLPTRPEVLAIDFLQAVRRPPGTDLGHALRELSDLATRLHLAVVCLLRTDGAPATGGADALDAELGSARAGADRIGWIAPALGSGLRRAEVLQNRYGARPAVPLRYDPATGLLVRHEADPGPS